MTTKELRQLTAYRKAPRGPYKQGDSMISAAYYPFPFKDGIVNNRKKRRGDLALERRRPGPLGSGTGKRVANGLRFRLTHQNWFLRIVREMKGNPRVEEAVISGKLVKFLPGAI